MTASGTAVERASVLRVLGTTVGLLVLLGLGFLLVRGLFARPIDGEAKARELFGDAALPFGLVLSEAVRLPTQDVLVRANPQVYFVPPYVGHRGWTGVRLDGGVDWGELAEIIDEAYRRIAPKRLLAQLDAR